MLSLRQRGGEGAKEECWVGLQFNTTWPPWELQREQPGTVNPRLARLCQVTGTGFIVARFCRHSVLGQLTHKAYKLFTSVLWERRSYQDISVALYEDYPASFIMDFYMRVLLKAPDPDGAWQ